MPSFDKVRWQAVSPLLDANPAQRHARLAQIQTHDRALADELASLLAINAQVETEQFLEGSPFDRVVIRDRSADGGSPFLAAPQHEPPLPLPLSLEGRGE